LQGDPILRSRKFEGGDSFETPSQGTIQEAYHI